VYPVIQSLRKRDAENGDKGRENRSGNMMVFHVVMAKKDPKPAHMVFLCETTVQHGPLVVFKCP
jgi:hypothetical protein